MANDDQPVLDEQTKGQMFYFTLIAALAFVTMAVNQLRHAGGDMTQLASLPKLGDGLVAILGISHAGYLTAKSIDHTPVRRK